MLRLPVLPKAAPLNSSDGAKQREFGRDILQCEVPRYADSQSGRTDSTRCRRACVQVSGIDIWNEEMKWRNLQCLRSVATWRRRGIVVGSRRWPSAKDMRITGSIEEEKSSITLRARASSSSKSDAPAAQPPPIMVNSVSGKMGRATAEAVVAAGLVLVPFTLVGRPAMEKDIDVMGVHVQVHPNSEREAILNEVLIKYPHMVIVDYTVPQAVNDNAEFYCRRHVPFVMGTTGGDRVKLTNDVLNSGNYAVIAPQMGKQVVAFQAAMQIMAEEFPGSFNGYKLQVTESHQSSKLDTSGTAKAVVASFVKLGLDFDISQIEKVREPEQQTQRMKVPEKYLPGHAYHTYRVVSPDNTVFFEFQHNVCGRSIYAEGTVDAVLFLAKKVEQKTEIKVYNMIDVLREGNMR